MNSLWRVCLCMMLRSIWENSLSDSGLIYLLLFTSIYEKLQAGFIVPFLLGSCISSIMLSSYATLLFSVKFSFESRWRSYYGVSMTVLLEYALKALWLCILVFTLFLTGLALNCINFIGVNLFLFLFRTSRRVSTIPFKLLSFIS